MNPPSPPLLTHLNAMSTLSPNHDYKQSKGFTKLINGGSLLAVIGTLNEFSSVTKVMLSSKSAKLGAQKHIFTTNDIPGAISPFYFDGYLTFLTVKFSLM